MVRKRKYQKRGIVEEEVGRGRGREIQILRGELGMRRKEDDHDGRRPQGRMTMYEYRSTVEEDDHEADHQLTMRKDDRGVGLPHGKLTKR